MLFNLGVTSRIEPSELLDLCAFAEDLGLERLWIGEDLTSGHDAYTMASVALSHTSRLKLGIGITSPYLHHASTIARVAVSLDEMRRGFILGLGVGGLSDLERLGIILKKPVGLMKDVTTVLRRVWMGENITFKGQGLTFRNFYDRYAPRKEIPILFGVRGPQLLQLAGEMADGAIISGPRKYLSKAVKMVKKAFQKSKNPSRPFTFVVWIPTLPLNSGSTPNLARRIVARIILDSPNSVLSMAEIDPDLVTKVKSTYHRLGVDRVSEMISEELVREFIVAGSFSEICETYHSLEMEGFERAILGPPISLNWTEAVKGVLKAWKTKTSNLD